VLLLKGSSLLQEAAALQPGWSWPLFAVAMGLFAGGLKARLLFAKACHTNLDRIAQLQQPKPWNCFRLRFFLLLILMILTGATLSRLAHGNYTALIAVATLDLSLATALLTSGTVFWKRRILV
jgi:hypothetical protein